MSHSGIQVESVVIDSLDPLAPAQCTGGIAALDVLDLLTAFPELLLALPLAA
jgi:hypothetical protein